MSNPDIKELYDTKAALYHRVFDDVLRYGAGLRAFLRPSDYLRPNLKILDAGCGSGVLTRTLHEMARERDLPGLTFHAFDLSESMLALFRR